LPANDPGKADKFLISEGQDRTRVSLEASAIGPDLIIRIYNDSPHMGAVAVGEYDFEHQRASVSVLTRLGHKDDALAQSCAHDISRSTHKPVCVIAGVHLDDITLDEIKLIQSNTRLVVERFLNQYLRS
jgi:hypothetical protein